jgi:hypothetical protein
LDASEQLFYGLKSQEMGIGCREEDKTVRSRHATRASFKHSGNDLLRDLLSPAVTFWNHPGYVKSCERLASHYFRLPCYGADVLYSSFRCIPGVAAALFEKTDQVGLAPGADRAAARCKIS